MHITLRQQLMATHGTLSLDGFFLVVCTPDCGLGLCFVLLLDCFGGCFVVFVVFGDCFVVF